MIRVYISWLNNEEDADERMTREQFVHRLFPRCDQQEILEQEFLEHQTLEPETFEQETVNQCCEDLKHKLNIQSADDEIRATIEGWYVDKRHALPIAYLMNGTVRLYICRLNKEEHGDQRMTMEQLFDRLYPNLKFT